MSIYKNLKIILKNQPIKHKLTLLTCTSVKLKNKLVLFENNFLNTVS